MSFRYLDSDGIALTIGSLDRPREVRPATQYGIESRIDWLDGIDALSGKNMETEMPAARKTKRIAYRHPDHDTPAGWKPPTAAIR